MQSRIFVYTIINVHITFDPAKDEANFAKHGVSLGLATELEWDTALTGPDTRKDYDESRMGCIGYVGLRLYVLVHVDRPDERRIISMRKENRREMTRYAET